MTLPEAIEEIEAIAKKYDYAVLRIRVNLYTESGEIPQISKELVVDTFAEYKHSKSRPKLT